MLSRKESADQSMKINTILGADAVFEGTFKAKETTRIDGFIKGDVEIEGTLILGGTGKISGNVKAVCIMVGGTVEGDLRSSDRTVISATGKVYGNVITKKLIVDENAVFQGKCVMETENAKPVANVTAAQA